MKVRLIRFLRTLKQVTLGDDRAERVHHIAIRQTAIPTIEVLGGVHQQCIFRGSLKGEG